ncbi:Actin-related protein 2/3 complex subunit 5 [Hypsizygus marmoreus]|uniref:Actin-related protein 2/3 complex subunit 5 n=1 Tax=Hypsizygus marmoreus TaxID=39966 RepID=A0A369JFQ9_HYPMA|nr:Actin-related protein 2/3 complex subunit 5 [Hypsizygus marmoreus]
MVAKSLFRRALKERCLAGPCQDLTHSRNKHKHPIPSQQYSIANDHDPLRSIMDTAFRKIDIDIYDEDVLQESELYDADPRDPAQVLEEARQRQAAVRTFLAKSDVVGALSTVLENAPYGPNVDQAKELTLQTLLTILNTTKSTEIPGVIKSLSQDAQDTLMKYLYKGMAMPGWGDISGSVLLGWHEKLTEIAGTGCIVRTMTDRRLV